MDQIHGTGVLALALGTRACGRGGSARGRSPPPVGPPGRPAGCPAAAPPGRSGWPTGAPHGDAPARRPGVEPRPPRYVPTRAEPAHPPRPRERRLPGGTSAGPAPRWLSASGPLAHPGRPHRHRCAAAADRQERRQRGQGWGELTSVRRASSERSRSKDGPIASFAWLKMRSGAISCQCP